jgi:ferrous iron transport protein A
VARITSLEDSEFQEKLMEMGCVAGVLIKPTLKAPFGDPIAFEVGEYTLSMRKKEAETIVVSLLDSLFEL